MPVTKSGTLATRNLKDDPWGHRRTFSETLRNVALEWRGGVTVEASED